MGQNQSEPDDPSVWTRGQRECMFCSEVRAGPASTARNEAVRRVRRGRRGASAILNSTGAREPEHTFPQPVPIVARVVWAEDGEEYIETVAAGWTGRNVYMRMPDRRYRLTACRLDAADIRRR